MKVFTVLLWTWCSGFQSKVSNIRITRSLIRFESRFELNHSVSVRNRITFATEDSTLDGVCYIITMSLIYEQCVCGLL